MPEAKFKNIDQVKKYFKKYGSVFVSTIVNKKPDKDKVPVRRSRIKWKCAGCKEEQECDLCSLINRENRVDKFYCQDCGTKFANCNSTEEEQPSVYDFEELLNSMGWELLDEYDSYQDQNSRIKVLCPKGHKTRKSYKLLNNGHDCAICVHTKNKIPEIKKEFIEFGFHLYKQTYINNETPLKWRCTCGDDFERSLKNMRKYHDGCGKCRKKIPFKEVEQIFIDNDCELITEKVKYVDDSTILTFICSCNDETQLSWKEYKYKKMCRDCKREDNNAKRRVKTVKK